MAHTRAAPPVEPILGQDVLRYLDGSFPEASPTTLLQDLEECPTEFRETPSLIGLHQRGQALARALAAGADAGTSIADLNVASFQHFYPEVGQAVDEERAAVKHSHVEAWRAWIKEAGRNHQGWAHKWTALREFWRPPKTCGPSTFTGQPLETLQAERERLMTIWNCSEVPPEMMQAPQEQLDALAPISVEVFMRAARSFPMRTAQTFDGFHPRHFNMLEDAQVQTVLKLLQLIEMAGAMPTAIRAVVAKLIPKLKAAGLTYRSIGLMASLYRQWCRCRQQEARAWEARNKDPIMGHQAGRSIMEVVYLEALRAEAGQAAEQRLHSGFFLWDLQNFCEYLTREKLWQRCEEMQLNLAIVAVALNQ